QNDLLAADYLSTKPVNLAIKTIHESFRPNLAPAFDPITIVYHKAASIASINSAFEDFIGCDPSGAAVVEQGGEYAMSLNVSETHGSTCSVNEGYIIILNAAAEDPSPVQINFENGEFEDYVFKAGPPNLVAPHLKNLQINYYSNAGDLLATLDKSIMVIGEASLPGAAVIVEPAQDAEGNLKIPLYVLRDPPGDNSFARLESGTEISTSRTLSREDQSDWGFYSDGKFGFGANALLGAFWNVDIRSGSSDANSSTNTTTFKTTTAYSTSDLEDKVGRSANVIVGTGMAAQYGLTQRIDWSSEYCDSISKSTQVRFGLGNLETTWAYTVEFIEQRIEQYVQDSILVELGLKTYYHSNGEPLAQNEAREKISAYIEGWRDIMHYHDVSSLPFYAFCKNMETPPFIKTPAEFEIEVWKTNFCGEIGTPPGDDFV
ncbi:MAG: hypothetical protein AAGK97_14890, partial [Bacteroidota bacterium]